MKTLLALIAIALGASSTASGQEPASKRLFVEARAGVRNPTKDLGRTPVLENQGFVSFAQAEAGPFVGVGVLAHLTGPLTLHAIADYAFDTDAPGQWACAPVVACPSVLYLVTGAVRRWSVAADLQYRPWASGWGFQPSVFAGVGLRHHRIRWESTIPEVPIPTAFDASDLFVRSGVGGERRMGPASLFVELEALIGRFGAEEERFIEGSVPGDRNTQVDLGLTAGVRLGIW